MHRLIVCVAIVTLLAPGIVQADPPAGLPAKNLKSSRSKRADQPVGSTPLGPLEVTAGDHTIVLTEPRSGASHTARIYVQAGQAAAVRHSFRVSGNQAGAGSDESDDYQGTAYLKALERQGIGLLNVTADPVGRVFIDDIDLVQTTPLVDHEVPAGQHEITVRFLTGGEGERDVVIRAGASHSLHFRP